MAVPLAFKPAPLDPRAEMMKQLEAAPREHVEALLVLFQTLQTAHDKGVLDLVHGLIGGKDIIATELAKGMKSTGGVNAVRNLIAVSKVLGSLDPDLLERVAQGFEQSAAEVNAEMEPPSLWQLFKQATGKDARRGMSFGVKMLASLGRATKRQG